MATRTPHPCPRAGAAEPHDAVLSQFDELCARPMEYVRNLYAHFDMELSEDATTNMTTWLEQNPTNKKHRGKKPVTHNTDFLGISAEQIRERMRLAAENGVKEAAVS